MANRAASENLTNAIDHFKFSAAALENIEETDCDAISDLTKIKDGRLDFDSLLAACLDGADHDRVQGWRDYCEEVCRIADLTR